MSRFRSACSSTEVSKAETLNIRQHTTNSLSLNASNGKYSTHLKSKPEDRLHCRAQCRVQKEGYCTRGGVIQGLYIPNAQLSLWRCNRPSCPSIRVGKNSYHDRHSSCGEQSLKSQGGLAIREPSGSDLAGRRTRMLQQRCGAPIRS